MDTTIGLIFITVIVTVDNALLTGLLLPNVEIRVRRVVLITVGVLLAISQVVLAASVDSLMHSIQFRIAAIVLLGWMSIRTLTMEFHRNRPRWTVVLRLWFLTAFGNLDNMIWLGAHMKGHYLELIVISVLVIPLFVATATLLSNECEKHKWILPLGAGMMAWAAATLTLDIPQVSSLVLTVDDAPRATLQALLTVAILLTGLGVRQFIGRSHRS